MLVVIQPSSSGFGPHTLSCIPGSVSDKKKNNNQPNKQKQKQKTNASRVK
jgi:hypothetical protein